MIIDALRDLDADRIDADLCIVGAGAAGITLAREFVGTKIQVCLLESGDLEPDPETQALYEGAIVGLDYFPLDATRLRFFGGTTNHWGGMCAPLAAIDFEDRPWLPMSGWPFGLDALKPYYARANRVCEIAVPDYDPAGLERRLGARRLPLQANRFKTTIINYSPPLRFGSRYYADLRQSDNVKVVLNANLLRFDANDSGRRVAGATVATFARREFNVRAKIYVLATGGIENPRILLLSNSVHKNGLGKQHGLVGKFFYGPSSKSGRKTHSGRQISGYHDV